MSFRAAFALSCFLISLISVASVSARAEEPSLADLCGAGQKINDSISEFFTVQAYSQAYDKVLEALRQVTTTVDVQLGKYDVPVDMLGLWETPDEFIQRAVTHISETNEEMRKRLVDGNLPAVFLNLEADMSQLRRAVIKLMDRTCYTLG